MSEKSHPISQQGLTNKSTKGTLTQQSILTFMSTSNKIQTPEKLNNPEKTKTYEAKLKQTLRSKQPTQLQPRINIRTDINSNDNDVSTYKSFSAITTATNTNNTKLLTQKRIPEYSQSISFNSSLKCSLLHQQSDRAPSKKPHSREGKPCGLNSHPALLRKTPTIDVPHPSLSPIPVDLLDQQNKILTSSDHAGTAHDALALPASTSGIEFGGVTDYLLQTKHETQASGSSLRFLQPEPNADDLAGECNIPKLQNPGPVSLYDGGHEGEQRQHHPSQSQDTQLQGTPQIPSHMDLAPPSTRASVLPAPCYAHLIVLQNNTTTITTNTEDRTSQLAQVHSMNVSAPVSIYAKSTGEEESRTANLDRSHLLIGPIHPPHDHIHTLQPGTDRPDGQGTLNSFPTYVSTGQTEDPCTPAHNSFQTTVPPPLKRAPNYTQKSGKITPTSLLADMERMSQLTHLPRNTTNPQANTT